MKIFLTVILTLSFVVHNGKILQSQNDLKIPLSQESPCPASNQRTHQVVKDYLEKEATIEDLTTNYGIDIDQNSHENVVALDNEEYAEECDALVQTFDYLTEDDEYSYAIYKVANHYFILQYRISDENEFSWNGISIHTSEFEAIAVAMNW